MFKTSPKRMHHSAGCLPTTPSLAQLLFQMITNACIAIEGPELPPHCNLCQYARHLGQKDIAVGLEPWTSAKAAANAATTRLCRSRPQPSTHCSNFEGKLHSLMVQKNDPKLQAATTKAI